MIAVVNLPIEDKMVAIMEPLWLDWEASVTCTPAMSLADLEKAGRDMERLATERGQERQEKSEFLNIFTLKKSCCCLFSCLPFEEAGSVAHPAFSLYHKRISSTFP